MIEIGMPAGTSIIPMFGHYIPSIYVSKAIELGVAGVAGMKLFFGFSEVGLFLGGQKELGEETGNEFYDGMKEWSDILAIEIILWGASNPRFWDNVYNKLFPQGAMGQGSETQPGMGGSVTVAQYGDDFGKMGTYVENPNIEVDWTQYAEHATERMQQNECNSEE